jgi:hypothetical protein
MLAKSVYDAGVRLSPLLDFEDAKTTARILGGEYVDVDKPFEPGNVYTQVAPFATVPSWMRQFMFRILKSNEIAVYLYIITFAQNPGAQIAWVSLREMQRDFGFSNRHGLCAAIEQLIELGFLLKMKGRVAKSKTEHDRSVYQRPSSMYTLLTLLRIGAIDGTFNPSEKAARRARRGGPTPTSKRQIERSMRGAIQTMLGPEPTKKYLHTPAAQKAQYLIGALVAQLTNQMRLAGASQDSINGITGT